jgi:hypothetical protein
MVKVKLICMRKSVEELKSKSKNEIEIEKMLAEPKLENRSESEIM